MTQSRFSCLLFLLVMFTLPRTYGQNRSPQPLDILHYRFDVRLEDSTDQVAVGAEVIIRYLDIPPAYTQLDLAHRSKRGFGMVVSSLSVNNVQTNFTHQSDQLKISTPTSAQKGDTLVLRLAYSGVPYNGLVISENSYGERTFFAEHWPNRAHQWLPVIDHPGEKATCEFAVTAPAKYQVVANGKKQSEFVQKNAYKRTVWKMDKPIPAKVMVIGVANFKTKILDSNGIITAWVYKQSGNKGIRDFSDAPAILDILTDLLGTYPYGKCDQVESTTRFGGMENAGNIFYPEGSLTGEHEINNTIAHEIGHQWFGNSVSEADWEDVWLSEGFATFLEYYFVQKFKGEKELLVKLAVEEKQILDYQRRYPKQTIVQRDIGALEDILNPLTYDKAAWALRALNRKVGNEVFREIVLTFYERYKYGNASTQDFFDVAAEISAMDLTLFFHQWFYVAGAPKIDYSWRYEGDRLTINFSQKTEYVYQMDLDIQLRYTDKRFESRAIRLTDRAQTIEVLCAKPTDLVIDPLNFVLGKFSER